MVGAFFLFTLSGCPGGAELEDPGKYGIAGVPATGTGGTTSAGGTTGSGGTGGGTGGGTTGGSGGTGGTMLTVNCTGTTYDVALKSCTQAGCHAANYPAAQLNLIPDSGLVARLKDIPAQHKDISCSGAGDTTCTCDPNSFTCSPPPSTCPAAGSALLVNSANYQQSWIITKLEQADPMCGIPMPDGPYKSPNDKACIEAMVQAIAMLPK